MIIKAVTKMLIGLSEFIYLVFIGYCFNMTFDLNKTLTCFFVFLNSNRISASCDKLSCSELILLKMDDENIFSKIKEIFNCMFVPFSSCLCSILLVPLLKMFKHDLFHIFNSSIKSLLIYSL